MPLDLRWITPRPLVIWLAMDDHSRAPIMEERGSARPERHERGISN
jgi:hypothetical protein